MDIEDGYSGVFVYLEIVPDHITIICLTCPGHSQWRSTSQSFVNYVYQILNLVCIFVSAQVAHGNRDDIQY